VSIATKLRRAPGRVAAGTFILNSGLNKLKMDDEGAAELHGMAVGAYPFLGSVKPKTFVRGLSAAEITIGGALLLPVAPPVLAGAGLAAFSGGLLGLYWRTPGLHSPNDPRPTKQGTPMAKDTWLAGIALGLLVDTLTPDLHTRRELKRSARRADKAEAHAADTEAKLDAAVDKAVGKVTRKASRKQRRDELGDLAGERVEATRRQAKAARKAAEKQAKAFRKTAKKRAKTATATAKDWTSTAQEKAGDAASTATDSLRHAASNASDTARQATHALTA